MDSSSAKEMLQQQVHYAVQAATTQTFMKKLERTCFEKCVPKPGADLSKGEQTCISDCQQKYMATWDLVYFAFLERSRRESSNME